MISWPSLLMNMIFPLSYPTNVVLLVPYNSAALVTPSVAESIVVNNNFSFVVVSSTTI